MSVFSIVPILKNRGERQKSIRDYHTQYNSEAFMTKRAETAAAAAKKKTTIATTNKLLHVNHEC